MALDGGGGGGGPIGAGNSFTGAAQALEVAGDFAYAYSGQFGASGTEVTHLEFTSGNFTFVGRMTVNGAVDIADIGNGRLTIFILTFNGTVISLLKTETLEEDMPNSIYNDIIIPPYTDVKVTAISDAGSSTRKTTVLMTGNIYRG